MILAGATIGDVCACALFETGSTVATATGALTDATTAAGVDAWVGTAGTAATALGLAAGTIACALAAFSEPLGVDGMTVMGSRSTRTPPLIGEFA